MPGLPDPVYVSAIVCVLVVGAIVIAIKNRRK
jgi:hypothetical protein